MRYTSFDADFDLYSFDDLMMQSDDHMLISFTFQTVLETLPVIFIWRILKYHVYLRKMEEEYKSSKQLRVENKTYLDLSAVRQHLIYTC